MPIYTTANSHTKNMGTEVIRPLSFVYFVALSDTMPSKIVKTDKKELIPILHTVIHML